ncbi:MAG: cupin domain-containing protein [Proteobacteria bacterium]|nr:cupin domain-containing protein [Pseudomonadota bacterium]
MPLSTFLAPVLALAPAVATAGTPPVELLTRPLPAGPARELRVLRVEYGPGEASRPHRHGAHVIVYVLEGHVRMQVAGQPAVTLAPGATFYEGPDDTHLVSANASDREPARLLVVLVKDPATPVSTPVAAAVAQ